MCVDLLGLRGGKRCACLSAALTAALVLRWVPVPAFGARRDCKNDSRPPTLQPWASLRAGHQLGPHRLQEDKTPLTTGSEASSLSASPCSYELGAANILWVRLSAQRGQVTIQNHKDEEGTCFSVKGISQWAMVWHLVSTCL